MYEIEENVGDRLGNFLQFLVKRTNPKCEDRLAPRDGIRFLDKANVEKSGKSESRANISAQPLSLLSLQQSMKYLWKHGRKMRPLWFGCISGGTGTNESNDVLNMCDLFNPGSRSVANCGSAAGRGLHPRQIHRWPHPMRLRGVVIRLRLFSLLSQLNLLVRKFNCRFIQLSAPHSPPPPRFGLHPAPSTPTCYSQRRHGFVINNIAQC